MVKIRIYFTKKQERKIFSNDTISTLNIGTLKSLEWEEEDIKNIPTQKSDNNLDLSLNFKSQKRNQNIELNFKNLEKLIHPIDDEFEKYIQNKIENLEKLKNGNDKNIKKNVNVNSINIINDNKINNNLILKKNNNDEKSIIKDKNEAIFTFNQNNIENNDNPDKIRQKRFIGDFSYNDNAFDNSIFNNNKNYDDNVGYKNKLRLKNLLSKIKSNKEDIELINKPNKFKLFDYSDENSGLNKIQRRYYDQFREEEKHKENTEYSKDYFASILYDYNKNK